MLYFVVWLGTVHRPMAAPVVSVRISTALERLIGLCTRPQGEILDDLVQVFGDDTCREIP